MSGRLHHWLHLVAVTGAAQVAVQAIGFVDGRPGFRYARMMWLFQQMIDFCLDAARRQETAGNE